ncbi:MAG: PadR family transcriptional regulator [Verrucomicrobiota bacterium]
MNDDTKARMEKMLREAGPILKKMDQVEVPSHVLAKLEEARQKKFPGWKELGEKEMESVVLQTLQLQSMDGFDLISRLEKAHVRLRNNAGEGVLYGLLSKLASAGAIQVELEDRAGQLRKFYRLTDAGRGLLQKVESKELQSVAAAVLAAG